MVVNRNQGAVSLQDVAVWLHPEDTVAVAKIELPKGMILRFEFADRRATELTVRQAIPGGHKVALFDVGAGETVLRYGQPIGFAKRKIQPGDHVIGCLTAFCARRTSTHVASMTLAHRSYTAVAVDGSTPCARISTVPSPTSLSDCAVSSPDSASLSITCWL